MIDGIFVGVVVGALVMLTPTILILTLRPPQPRLDGLTPEGRRIFHGRAGRRHRAKAEGRRFRVYTRTAMQDLYACVAVPLAHEPEGTLRLGPVEAFGFTSVTLTDGTLTYTGSDRRRLLHDPLNQHPALDDGPRPDGDGRRVHHQLADGHLMLGFRQVTDERLPGILRAMAALADTIEAEFQRPWVELCDRYGLSGGRGLVQGRIEGCEVIVEPGLARLRHGLELPAGFSLGHKDRVDGQPLGNAVVDLCLRVVAAGDFRLDNDQVEPLLEVLHGRPGSMLQEETLSVVVDDEDLAGGVRAALALVSALR